MADGTRQVQNGLVSPSTGRRRTETTTMLPVLGGLTAVAVLSAMDAVIKEAGSGIGTAQVVLLRYAFGLAAVLPLLLVRSIERPTWATLRRAAFRVVFIIGTAYFFFKTLSLLPLAEAIAITFTAPFFMLVASRILLGEPMPRRSLAAIAIGFAGVMVMVAGRGGGGHGDWLGYATGLACSVTYALSMILMRRDTGHDGVVALVFAQNLSAFLVAIPLGAATWVEPSAHTVWLFGLAGALGTLGHLAMAFSYARAPASRLAPLEYTAFLWAAAFGVVFFGEVPSPWTIGGAALIVGACLMVFGRRAADGV